MTGSDGSPSRYRSETDWPLLALLRRHGRPYALYAVFGIALRLAWVIPAQTAPALVGYAFDTVFSDQRAFEPPLVPMTWVPESQFGQLQLVVGILVGLVLVGAVVDWVRNLAWGVFAYRLQHDIRTATYDAVQRLEMEFFDDHQTGEVMSILNNDVNEMEGFFTDTIGSAMWVVAYLLGVGFYMVVLNWQFALVALSIAPVIVVVNYWFAGRIETVYEDVREAVGELNAQIQTSISGIEVVKAYTAESFERTRVAEASRKHYRKQLDGIDVRSKHYPGMRALTGAGLTITFGVGGYWVLDGPPGPFTLELTGGMLLTYLIYAQGVMWPMRQVAGVIEGYESARASAQRILGVKAAGETVTDPDEPVELLPVEGRVTYEDVTFSYPTDDDAGPLDQGPTLRDVSFDVQPGETVGIVGPTGAGKSTLVKLLVRFYDVDEGAVRIDGRDVRECSLSDLRGSVGYIAQDPFLFSGTVRENVTYGMPDADESTVRAALDRAEATEFVEELPDGIDTTIGERGVKLSGGQRQRLSLARTMVHDPAILVLDEATSHVDNETEALIQRSIASVVADRTTLVIAHRLSTVRDADRIVVLEDGEVAETGSHDELLDRDGLYAALWRVQVGDIDALPDEFVDRIEERADTLRTNDGAGSTD